MRRRSQEARPFIRRPVLYVLGFELVSLLEIFVSLLVILSRLRISPLIKKRLRLIGGGRQGNGQYQQNDSCRAYQAFHDWSPRRQSSPSRLGHSLGRVALICVEEDKSCVIITSLQYFGSDCCGSSYSVGLVPIAKAANRSQVLGARSLPSSVPRRQADIGDPAAETRHA